MTEKKPTLEYGRPIPRPPWRWRWRWWMDAVFWLFIAAALVGIILPVFATARY